MAQVRSCALWHTPKETCGVVCAKAETCLTLLVTLETDSHCTCERGGACDGDARVTASCPEGREWGKGYELARESSRGHCRIGQSFNIEDAL